MKKIRVLLLSILLLIPVAVCAKGVDVDYKVEKVYISADLDIVGSFHVKEAIVVNGSLNGFRRDLLYKNSNLNDWEAGNIDFSNSSIYNARGVTLEKVSAYSVDRNSIDWNVLDLLSEEFELKNSADIGDNKVYTVSDVADGVEVKIFNQNKSGYMVYYYEYYIDQVAVLHNDVAEIYYTFFRLDNDDVGEVSIQVTLPGSSTDETFKFWGHGATNGTIRGISTSKDDGGNDLYNGVLLKVNNYNGGDALDIRMTFDKYIVSTLGDILNNSKMDALDKIIEVESIREKQEIERAQNLKLKEKEVTRVAIIYIVGLILLWLYVYRKYDREEKVDFNMKYYREVPSNYDVTTVDYLMNETITGNAFTASIINFIYKGNILVENNDDSKKNIKLILNNRNKTSDSEKLLLALLFDTIGDGKEVTLDEIEKFANGNKFGDVFVDKYNEWVEKASEAARSEKFFSDIKFPRIYAVLYMILGIVIFFYILLYAIDHIPIMILVFFGSMGFLIYVLSVKKMTYKGRLEYLKWNAFRNYLKDFGSFNDNDVLNTVLWDRYIVYATLFGVSKELQKAMKEYVNVNNLNISSLRLYSNDFMVYTAIYRSLQCSHASFTSSSSSDSVSSGGGFAGGGGGGGGF